MTKIGSPTGRHRHPVPDNFNQSHKANARLEQQTSAANRRLEEALKVDGVRVLLWHKHPPAGRVCSCMSGAGSAPSPDAGLSPATNTSKDPSSTAILSPPMSSGDEKQPWSILGVGTDEQPHWRVRSKPNTEGETEADKRTDLNDLANARVGPKRTTDHRYESRLKTGHNIISTEDLVEENDPAAFLASQLGGSPGQTAPPTTFNAFVAGGGNTTANLSNSVSCPVCVSAIYIEAWQPFGGRREVMSFLPSDNFETDGILDLTAKPYVLKLAAGQTLSFTLKLPKVFANAIHANLWNGRTPYIGDEFIPEVYNGTVYVPATPKNLDKLSGSAAPKLFRIKAPAAMTITHFDIVVLLADPAYGQFAPLNATLEQEFLEYMTNTSIEVSASLNPIDTGDLLVDWKFRKTWRITTLTPKFTAGGRALQTVMDIRVVSGQEVFNVLNPFPRPINTGPKTYADNQPGIDDWQGGGYVDDVDGPDQ